MSRQILITGASGFVGQVLCRELRLRNFNLTLALRKIRSDFSDHTQLIIPVFDSHTDFSTVLNGVHIVIHLAARVHIRNDKSINSLDAFRRTNVDATANLARQAAAAGVKRFVFLSSIKVNGEFTELGKPFTANDVPAPQDPYGVSKQEAEQLLRQIAVDTGMEVVIIRPPLIYGPGVKANFESMMRWLTRGLPLPLAAASRNRRSLVALDNLIDLIATCLNHPAAANQTFLVSDGEDFSTADLLERMGAAMGHPARLFYLPLGLLKFGTAAVRNPGIYQRLCGSLQLDISKTSRLLGWSPPISVDEGLRRAAEGFRP